MNKGKCVQVLSDNVSAVASVNFKRGPPVDLTTLAKAIWEEVLCDHAAIFVKQLTGRLNVQAEYLSRLPHHYEWKLHPSIFQPLDPI